MCERPNSLLTISSTTFSLSIVLRHVLYGSDFLLSRDLSFSSHAAVISAFGREFVKSGEVPKDLHRYLIDATKARTDGDYSTEIRLSQDDAIVQLQRAQVFLDVARKSLRSNVI